VYSYLTTAWKCTDFDNDVIAFNIKKISIIPYSKIQLNYFCMTLFVKYIVNEYCCSINIKYCCTNICLLQLDISQISQKASGTIEM
jgi:hypothetical protein